MSESPTHGPGIWGALESGLGIKAPAFAEDRIARNAERAALRLVYAGADNFDSVPNASFAEVGSTNGGLTERAAAYVRHDQVIRQANREAILAKALALLDNVGTAEDEDGDEDISDDWLHYFTAIAETKSADDARARWARVLAEEIRLPGTSPRALDLIGKISMSELTTISKVLGYVVNDAELPSYARENGYVSDEEVQLMHELAILKGDLLTTETTIKGVGSVGIRYFEQAGVINATRHEVAFNTTILTSMGRDVLRLIADVVPDLVYFEALIRSLIEPGDTGFIAEVQGEVGVSVALGKTLRFLQGPAVLSGQE